MTVSDYIINFLAKKGTDTVFMITGGQAMFLNDAVCRYKKIKPICMHHEQAVAMSAEAYGRITGKPGVALVTAGPAAVNTMNGVVGGWTDSSPMIIISGQSALSCVQYQQKTKIRQYGIQGINIKPLVESVTKFFITVDDPAKIQYYMQKAYHLATTGRPGPVWIDVPLDIQRMPVPTRMLKQFIPQADNSNQQLEKEVDKALRMIKQASYPILLVGQGVKLSGAVKEFRRLANTFKMPVLTSRLGIDLINSDNRLYVGRPGIYGERAANFAVQNSDLIVAIGSRLASALVGHNPQDFGRNARKIVVDVDQKELEKPGVKIDLTIQADAKVVITEMLRQLNKTKLPTFKAWVKRCSYWKKTYPVVLASYKKEKPINSYYFIDQLSEVASNKDFVLVDTGSCFHVAAQAWKIKKGQQFLTTGGLSSMGWWVAGIGASMANPGQNTIIITGDGSLQFNIQEFATIKCHNLPIKVFIFNNNGYLLIKHTQANFMDGRLIGVSPKTGLWCPDSLKIAKAYEIQGVRLSSTKNLAEKIKAVLAIKGPVICDVMTPEWQLLGPRTSSEKAPDGHLVAKPYEDMFPFLDRDEFKTANQPG